MKRMICVAALVLALCQLALPASAVELDVAGKSAVLMDVATGTVLYESNSHERLAPASVTKVMTMLLIMEAVDSGKIALTDMVTASEAAAAKGGSQIYLKAGETMPVSGLMKSLSLVIPVSSVSSDLETYGSRSLPYFVSTTLRPFRAKSLTFSSSSSPAMAWLRLD